MAVEREDLIRMADTLLVATLLTGTGPTGVETHFNQLISAAAQRGVDARLVSAQGANDWRRKVDAVVFRTMRRFDAERALRFVRRAAARQLGRKLRRELDRIGTHRVTICAQDSLSALSALQSRRSNDVRIVMTVHFNESEAQEMAVKGLTAEGRPLWADAMQTERCVMPRLDHIVFVSDFMRAHVLERHPDLDRRRISVIPNFCEPAETAFHVEPDADLIAIGTLEPRKNQRFLLDVLGRCHALGYMYTLTLAGNGPDAASLAAYAAQLGLTGHVHFLGHRPHASRLIPRHRAFVHGAVMENLSIGLLEALAAGRPVFAGPVGGTPEIFADGVEGRYWPLDAPDRAAALLVDALETPKRWSEMSAAARARYDSSFSAQRLVPRWLEAVLGHPIRSEARSACERG